MASDTISCKSVSRYAVTSVAALCVHADLTAVIGRCGVAFVQIYSGIEVVAVKALGIIILIVRMHNVTQDGHAKLANKSEQPPLGNIAHVFIQECSSSHGII